MPTRIVSDNIHATTIAVATEQTPAILERSDTVFCIFPHMRSRSQVMAAGCSEIKKIQYRLRKIWVLSNSQESSFPFLRVRAAPGFLDFHSFVESVVSPREIKVSGKSVGVRTPQKV